MTTVGVVGTGVMGAGIAQVAAAHGCTVYLLDVNTEVVQKALGGITKNLDRLVEKGKMPAVERDAAVRRLHGAAGPEGLAACELVIEAVSENLEVKTKVLGPLVKAASPTTVFASNTSSLSVTQIGRAVGVAHRLAGMHFFNPAPLMPLVEVIAGDDTEPAVVDRVAALAAAWGKTVVRAKDTPGFIVNRVARGYYLEALRLLGEGVAGLDEIDRTMRQLGGFRMGPFELMDLVGIDVNYSVSCSVWEQMGRPVRLTPHPLQAELLQRGQLGRKRKRGFYSYDADPPTPVVRIERRPLTLPASVRGATEAFVERAATHKGTDVEDYVFARILATVLNEAALALQEGVATREDIDTAMRLGTNYPRGLLEWAEQIGHERCGKMLLALNMTATDRRFVPSPMFSLQDAVVRALNDDVVRSELRRAWQESHPGSTDAHEEGGFVLLQADGTLTVERWPRGAQDEIRVPPHEDGRRANHPIVATFHTHPNMGPEYVQEPSPTDIRAVCDDPDLGNAEYEGEYVISHDIIYRIRRTGEVEELGETSRLLSADS